MSHTPIVAPKVAPKVALIGRPNVGKSTLFNRLAGKKLALVDNQPGVTRDWREAPASLGGFDFTVIDTAGLEEANKDTLSARMFAQSEQAIAAADVILFLVDGRAGVTPLDESFAKKLRKLNKPVILVANKSEARSVRETLSEAYRLGLGDPIPLSAEHGEGLADLLESLMPYLPDPDAEPEDGSEEFTGPIQLAIVGRPNVGKSTLLNAIIGERRVLTGPEAGMTRDAIRVPYHHNDQEFALIDTAGQRRKSKVQKKVEKLAVADGLRAVQYAEIVALVIDATEGMNKQDLSIAEHVIEEGRCLIILANKWDLVEEPEKTLREIQIRLEKSLPQVKDIPCLTIAAIKQKNYAKLFEKTLELHGMWNTRISTGRLNDWLADIVGHHPPPLVKGRRLKLRYMTQIKTRPPTLAVFCNMPKDLPESYKRYLVNQMRKSFELPAIPIRLVTRGGKNPYVSQKD